MKAPEISNDSKNLAFICHLAGFFWFVIPGLNIIAPLVILLIRGRDDEFVSHHGRQALVFQVIMSVAMIFLMLFGIILLIILVGVFFLMAAVFVAVIDVIFILIATFAASRGELYTYPLLGRL